MKHFEVDTSKGTIQHPAVSVYLETDPDGRPVPGTGVRIQPVSLFVIQEITKELNDCARKGVKAFAAELGKEVYELTPEEKNQANGVATVDQAIIDRIRSLFLERVVGWDEGLVQANGVPLAPDSPVGDGARTVKDLFVDSLVGSAPHRAILLLTQAATGGVDLEGNFKGTSGGSGDSGGTPAASTASDSSSPDAPTDQQTDADSSEVAAVPV